ncbi:restriction endonuclease subunit S [Ligilactobacillus salivarius]|uniref:restriction endonuclease subunit S n=1 Tax=Ligilactobacillus salivarius TaxID=1624 RepID=UPI00191D3825|nr:restriction endonuclease subunit S [Ligilactobacillus salivarius]MBL1069820.1 restriction endonuclease subunit S [Ligilactobacillus salivarius]
MDNKKNGIPKLRFPGFTGAWEQRKLGGFLQEYSIKSKIENEYPLLSSTNKGMEYREGRTASESNIGYKILKINDLVLSPQNLWLGNININTLVTGIVSPSYKTLKINNLSLYFLLPQLKTKRMLEKYKQVSVQGASVVRRNLDFTEFMNISLVIPTNKEQEQIGEFFKQLDSLIALHQRKLEHLQEQKKGLLQKMFPKNGEIVPEVRFPGFTDAWEQRKLGEVATRVTRKNKNLESTLPLTISAQLGLVDQISYFDKRIASSNLTNYILLNRGEFAYNKSYSNGYPFGTVKRLNRYDKGVIPSLYIAFMPNTIFINSDFMEMYFETSLWHKEVSARASEGARNHGLLNISPSDFMDIYMKIPEKIEEQKKIAKFLEDFDSLIALHQRKLDHLELMKKGLLQQMFV